MIERATYTSSEVFKVDKEGMIEGWAIKFESPIESWFPTIMRPKGRDPFMLRNRRDRIKMLAGHDPDKLIGTFKQLTVKKDGLYVKGKVTPGTQASDEALTLMRDGALDRLSIGFSPKLFEWDEEPDIDWVDGEKLKEPLRILQRVKLFEVSPVAFAANDDAHITEVHSEAFGSREQLDFTVLPTSYPWSAKGAVERIREWADGDESLFESAFLVKAGGNRFDLPFVDVVHDELMVVPDALLDAALRMHELSDAERYNAEGVVRHYKARLKRDRTSILPTRGYAFDETRNEPPLAPPRPTAQPSADPEDLNERFLTFFRDNADELRELLSEQKPDPTPDGVEGLSDEEVAAILGDLVEADEQMATLLAADVT